MAPEITSDNVDQVDPSRLLQAAMADNVGELEDFIRRDPNILHKFSLSSFTETPLHISSLRGHTEFIKILLNTKPEMAAEPNPKGYCPLHYAAAEGHVEVVKALLKSRKEVCMFRVEDGKIPLHFAVMRDRVEVVKLLVAATPNSIAVLLNGETVFHLAVRYNRLESLKELLKVDTTDEAIKGNDDGNTILHLAAMLKQLECLKYVISVPKLKVIINASNQIGFSALDLLEYVCPKDLETLQVVYLLVEAGATRVRKREDDARPHPPPQPGFLSLTTPTLPMQSNSQPLDRVSRKFQRFVNCFAFDWIDGARGSLMVVATVIAQMAYQSAVNPPGGVWQQSFSNSDKRNIDYCGDDDDDICFAGTAIVAYAYEEMYRTFVKFNSVGFVASLGMILLMVAGFPVDNKYSLFVFTVAMCVSVTSLGLTYVLSILFLSPNPEDNRKDAESMAKGWLALLVVVGLVYMIRILHWVVLKFITLKSVLSAKIRQHQQNSSTRKFQMS